MPTRHFFTHAWLPKDKFDGVLEVDGWIFAHKDDGYLALRSQNPYFWNSESEGQGYPFEFRHTPEDMDREVIAQGAQNIWVCQLGRKADDGSFEQFVETISAAELSFNGLKVEYRSPGNGLVRFGWTAPLSVDDIEIQLKDYPRYNNPYVQAEFDTTKIHIEAGGYKLSLNWETVERINL